MRMSVGAAARRRKTRTASLTSALKSHGSARNHEKSLHASRIFCYTGFTNNTFVNTPRATHRLKHIYEFHNTKQQMTTPVYSCSGPIEVKVAQKRHVVNTSSILWE